MLLRLLLLLLLAAPAAPALSPSHRFGFVVGVHFSGTSILHYALGRHPDVSIMHGAPKRMDEGQFFQDVLPNGAHRTTSARSTLTASVQRASWAKRLCERYVCAA